MRSIEKTKEKYRQEGRQEGIKEGIKEGRQEVIKESQEWVEVNENEIDISKGSPPPWETQAHRNSYPS